MHAADRLRELIDHCRRAWGQGRLLPADEANQHLHEAFALLEAEDSSPPTRAPGGEALTPPVPRTTEDGEAPPTVPPPSGPSGGEAAVPGYEILSELGRGGMGVVFRARQRSLDRVVALKMMLPRSLADPGGRQLFLKEAENAAKIRHECVVQIYDYGEYAGSPYLAMELCPCGSLADRLARGPLPPAEAVRLVERLARGLQAAHEAGVIHRDLKPGNVMLVEKPSDAAEAQPALAPPAAGELAGVSRPATVVPKITDFGLAKRLEAPRVTQTGVVMGTPSYMAPEQARDSSRAAVPADVYAAGAVLYECLAGRPPFQAATLTDTLLQSLNDEPVSPRSLNPSVPRDLETICLKCLRKEPQLRYASAAELGDELGRWMRHEPIHARPAGPVERAAKWARRNKVAASFLAFVVLAGTVLAVVGGLALGLLFENKDLVRADQKTKEAIKGRAVAQIDRVLEAPPADAPRVIRFLERDLKEAREVLHQRHDDERDPVRRDRLYWALLASDPRGYEKLPDGVIERLLDANADHHALLRPLLALNSREVSERMLAEVAKNADAATQEQREKLARRQATAAATLLYLDHLEPGRTALDPVWKLFRHSADPTRRSYLVWHAGQMGGAPRLLIDRLHVETDPSARRALILALGEYSDKELPSKEREPLVKDLLRWYRGDDPGVRAAIDWLLRHKDEGAARRPLDWGQAGELRTIDRGLRGERSEPTKPAARKQGGTGWYANSQGQTMVEIHGAVDFHMGSPQAEADRLGEREPRHLRRIERSFAIASNPVTQDQYREYLEAHGRDATKWRGDAPVVNVSWYEAAAYCNWLSEKEGLGPCYPDHFGPDDKPADHWWRWGRRAGATGYRLPTEAEWEYACRAGAETSRHFGSSAALLFRYAAFGDSRRGKPWPVGQRRPNDFGLFDAHGNVWNWCHDSGHHLGVGDGPVIDWQDRMCDSPSGPDYDGRESDIRLRKQEYRALRGGSFLDPAANVRSAFRSNRYRPTLKEIDVGFRVARTLPE